MKISPELRDKIQRVLEYVADNGHTSDEAENMADLARDAYSGLEYKKRGRKVGWRKKPVNGRPDLNTHEGVIEQAYKEHTGQI